MLSTVLGLSVRVYLVSFKQEIGDAIKDAEDAVLEATRKFTEQLIIALERLQAFESQVNTASKSSVEHVNLQIENLSKNHAEKLTGFFSDLTSQNQKMFILALAEIKTASRQLADSIEGYSQGIHSNLTSIEVKVGDFTEAVTNRLNTTTFPDDYFAKHLQAPLSQLTESASTLASEVKQVSTEVGKSSVVLSGALKKIRDKANATENSLDTVFKLTMQQQAVLDSAQGQLTTIGQLTTSLASFDTVLSSTLSGINASNLVASELTSRVSSVVEESAAARKSLEKSLVAVISKLESNATATTTVASKLDASATANMAAAATISEKLDANSTATKAAASTIGSYLEASATATNSVTERLGAAAAVDVEAASALVTLGQHASTAIGKVDQAVEQLQAMVSQLFALDMALRTQSSELKQVADHIKDVKVVVEMPQSILQHTSTHLPEIASIPFSVAGPLVQSALSTSSGE